jgi:DNA-binding GntR family transcriptional regulator
LAEQASEELQSQIVSGRLPAGHRLLADELADELEISQTPVKEAMALLERDGLIEGTSRRASSVRSYTRQDIVEIYEARVMLELNALESGAGRIDAHFLDTVQQLHEAQMRHADRQTAEDLAEAIGFDREFHESFVGLTGNRLLMGWHRNILRQTQTIRNHSIATYDAKRSRLDHGLVIEALRQRDIAGAQRLLRVHLISSRDGLLSRWQGDHAASP